MSSLLDQSALTDLAERLVAAARRAGADAADALALRSVSLAVEVREGAVEELEERARHAETAALAVKGVTTSGGASASAGIGGMVLVTSHGFAGAYLGSGQGISMTAIAGEGTAMERDYDYSSTVHGADF